METHNEEWFIKRIGKRIFRLTKNGKGDEEHCCMHCKKVYDEGLIIHDKQHADYLWCGQGEMGLRYSDVNN